MGHTPLPAGELTRSAISVYISLAGYQKGVAPCPCGKGATVLRPKKKHPKDQGRTRDIHIASGEHDRTPRIATLQERFYE
jgi:hypothetical protein